MFFGLEGSAPQGSAAPTVVAPSAEPPLDQDQDQDQDEAYKLLKRLHGGSASPDHGDDDFTPKALESSKKQKRPPLSLTQQQPQVPWSD